MWGHCEPCSLAGTEPVSDRATGGDMDYFELAKCVTSDYAERLLQEDLSRIKNDVIQRQAEVIETLQQIVKVQNEQIETLKKALQA